MIKLVLLTLAAFVSAQGDVGFGGMIRDTPSSKTGGGDLNNPNNRNESKYERRYKKHKEERDSQPDERPGSEYWSELTHEER